MVKISFIKRLTCCLMFLLLFLIVLNGCNNKSTNNKTDIVNPADKLNATLEIRDADKNLIDELQYYGSYFLPGGMIYYQIPESSSWGVNGNYTANFYWYEWETKESELLGTISDIAHITTGPVYIDSHLYMYVITGDLYTEEHWLKLIDLDIENLTMTEIFSEKDGCPYNSMAAQGDRLLMGKVLTGGASYLEEYNTKTGERKILLEPEFDADAWEGDTIRSVTSDGKTISLIVVEGHGEDSDQLRMDVYDLDMNFLHSVDLSHISSDNNELRDWVAWFVASGDIVYYESYSNNSFLGRIENGKAERILETTGDPGQYIFSTAVETQRDTRTGVFIRAFDNDEHYIYRVNYTDGSMERASFCPEETDEVLQGLWRDGDDNLFIGMDDMESSAAQTGVTVIYRVPLSELEFEPFL